MLEQRRVTPSDLVDVALGALDSWVRPQVASEGRRTLVVSKMRTSLLAVLWAWIGLVLAGVGFQKMSEYEDFVGAARENQVVGLSDDRRELMAFEWYPAPVPDAADLY
jgi:hypothetical protein